MNLQINCQNSNLTLHFKLSSKLCDITVNFEWQIVWSFLIIWLSARYNVNWKFLEQSLKRKKKRKEKINKWMNVNWIAVYTERVVWTCWFYFWQISEVNCRGFRYEKLTTCYFAQKKKINERERNEKEAKKIPEATN